jgi:hypothetical protein
LHTVIEDEGVCFEVFDSGCGGAASVAVGEDDDVAERFGKHVGLIAGEAAVEEEIFPVVNDAREGWGDISPAVLPASEDGWFAGFVASGENGDAATVVLEGACEEFDDRSFSGSTDGEVADGDDGAAGKRGFEMAGPVEMDSEAHDGSEKLTKEEEEGTKEGGAFTTASVQDDVDGEAFEVLESPFCHGEN